MASAGAAANAAAQSSQRYLASGTYSTWANDFKASKEPGKQAKYLQDLKDHVDAKTGEHPAEFYTEILSGVLLARLKQEPSFVQGEHKNRTICLEILERIPRAEPLRKYWPEILQTLTWVAERDSEENAIIALRILSEFQKIQQSGQDSDMSLLIEMLKKAHLGFANVAGHAFKPIAGGQPNDPNRKEAGAPGGAPSAASNVPAAAGPQTITRADQSFKIISESGPQLTLLFKVYTSLFNLREWIPILIRTLEYVAPDNAMNDHRAAYTEMLTAQAKTFHVICSFIAWDVNHPQRKVDDRKTQELTETMPSLKMLPHLVVQLLRNCTQDGFSIRKDLLLGWRQLVHLQSNPPLTATAWSEFWHNFLEQMDSMMDENVVIGTGRTAQENLKATAWMVVAEYANPYRTKLTLNQLVRMVGLYGKICHDPTSQLSTVVLSVKFLSKLGEVVGAPDAPDPAIRAQLLLRIIDIMAHKLKQISRQIDSIFKGVLAAEQKEKEKAAQLAKANPPSESEEASSQTDNNTNTNNDVNKNGGDDNDSMAIDAAPQASDEQTSTSAAQSSKNGKKVEKTPEQIEEEKMKAYQAKVTSLYESTKEAALSKDEPAAPATHLLDTTLILVDMLLTHLKLLCTSLQTHHLTHRPQFRSVLTEEAHVFRRILKHGLLCLTLYDTPRSSPTDTISSSSSTSNAVVASTGEKSASSTSSSTSSPQLHLVVRLPAHAEHFERDFDCLSVVIIGLDQNLMEDVLTSTLPWIYQKILEHPYLVSFFTHLTNTNAPIPQNNTTPVFPVSKHLNEILLNFLISKIPNLSNADAVEANVIHRAFKPIFSAIGRISDDPNTHPSWAPILSGVISQILRLATESRDPLNYFILLRYLSRLVVKPDIWSKELTHSLPTIVDTMNRIQENTSQQQLRDILIELPITLPIRHSCYLPCFKQVIKPLILALESPESEYNPTKGAFGLKQLETFLGQFSADFMEPLIADYKTRLLKALWKHFRTPSNQLTSTVMRILGRLGGKIRPFPAPQFAVTQDEYPGLVLSLSFDHDDDHLANGSMEQQVQPRPAKILEIPLQEAILAARRTLLAYVHASVLALTNPRRQTAFNFLKLCLIALLRPYANSPLATERISFVTSTEQSRINVFGPDHPLHLLERGSYPSFAKIIDRTSPGVSNGNLEGTTISKSIRQLESEQHLFKLIFSTLVTCLSLDALKTQATEFVEQVCNHFALLFASRAAPSTEGLAELDLNLFVDVLTDVLASEIRDHAPAALTAINCLVTSCMKLDPDYVAPSPSAVSTNKMDIVTSTSTEPKKSAQKDEFVFNDVPATPFMINLPVFNLLVPKICDLCFKREWFFKAGGCSGIRHLVTIMPAAWIRHHQVKLLQAAMFILKDYPLGATVAVPEDATQVVYDVLRAANSTLTPNGLTMPTPLLADALSFLVHSLSSTGSTVRKTAQVALEKLSEWSQVELTTLLEPYKSTILDIVKRHQLTKLGPKFQMGLMDTVTFVLNLKPCLFLESNDLRTFLFDVSQLAEAEETSRNTPLYTPLFVSVTDCMSAALSWKPFHVPEFGDIRFKFISFLLKALASTNRQLNTSSRKGLEAVASEVTKKAPKLLGEVMAPVWNKIGEGKFSEQLLDCLSRFLAVFPKSFSAELGKKLLDQLLPYTEMNPVHKLEPGESPVKIAASIVEIFSLLPFADKVIDQVIRIAVKLDTLSPLWGSSPKRMGPREFASPFRVPLAKFLNRFPVESVACFFMEIQSPDYAGVIINCLKSDQATQFREELSKHGQKLAEACFSPSAANAMNPDAPFHLQYVGISVVRTLIRYYPDWLSNNREVFDHLYSIFKSQEVKDRLQNESTASLRHSKGITLLTKCMIHFVKQHHNEVGVLLDLVPMLMIRSCGTTVELNTFFEKYLIEQYTVMEKRALIDRILKDYGPNPQQPVFPVEHKRQILKSIIIPLFESSLSKGEEILTKAMIQSIVSDVFVLDPNDTFGTTSALAYELLSVLILMQKYLNTELQDQLRDLVKFGWPFLRNEDLLTRQTAHSIFSRIIKESFSVAPPKIRLTIYVALLRIYQVEVRASVRESLDFLVPALLSTTASTPTDLDMYIKWTKRVLTEESHQMPPLMHILYVITKFEPYFRNWRSMFYGALASAVIKLAPQANQCPAEQKRLAVAVIDVLLNWEKLRIKNAAAASSADSLDSSTQIAAPATTSNGTSLSTTSGQQHTPSPAEHTPASGGSQIISPTTSASSTATPGSGNAMDIALQTATQDSSNPNSATAKPASADHGDGKLSPVQMENLLFCLLTATVAVDQPSRGSSMSMVDLSPVFLRLFQEAVGVWGISCVKTATLFSRILEKAEDVRQPKALSLLHVIFSAQPSNIVNYTAELSRSLPALSLSELADVGPAFLRLLRLLLQHYPNVPGSPLEQVYAAIMTEMDKAMASEKPPVETIYNFLKTIHPIHSNSYLTASASNTAAASSPASVSTSAHQSTESKQDPSTSEQSAMDITPTTVKPVVESNGHDGNAMEGVAISSGSTLGDGSTTTSATVVSSSSATESTPGESTLQEQPRPQPIDVIGPIIPSIFKLLAKSKDSVLFAKQEAPADPNTPAKKPDCSALLYLLRLLAPRLPTLPLDLKKTYFAIVQQLIDKSNDEPFLIDLIALVEIILNDTNMGLDHRAKSTMLQHLKRFEKIRVGPISLTYYNIVYTMYQQQENRSDIPNLEPAFMHIMTCRDATVRHKFMKIFEEQLPKTVAERLEHLLRQQTWEALPQLSWIQPSIELLLNLANLDRPLTLGISSARLPQPRWASPHHHASKKITDASQSVYDKEKTFLKHIQERTTGELLKNLIEMLHYELDVASALWPSIFKELVHKECFSSDALKRKSLFNIQSIITQDSQHRPQRLHPFVAQALLKGVHGAGLYLPPTLIKYIGSTFNAWHLSIHMLEDRIFKGFGGHSPDAPPGVVLHFPNHPTSLYNSLGDLYTKLYEEDSAAALYVNQFVMDDTKAGIALQQQGAWSRSQEVFYQALHDASKGIITHVSQRERDFWEGQWIECAKRLNQWDVLSTYAKSIGSSELLAEAAWKTADWETLKEVLTKFPANETPKGAMLQAYSQIVDKIPELDVQTMMTLIVSQWGTMPRLPGPCYTPLLVVLQRFIDVHDSGKIIKDLKSPDFHLKISDIKSIQFRSWRERLPHDCDDLTLWHDVLQWRQHVFSILAHALAQLPTTNPPIPNPLLGLGHHEAAWAINKLAHVSRKHGVVDIGFASLPRIYELPNIEVQDAFTKVCEHIKCFLKLPLSSIRGVLEIIHTTNLSYFSPNQKAEFFHLKAEFYARTGAYEEAAKAFSIAAQCYSSLPKVWSGWGKFYSERFLALHHSSPYASSLTSVAAAAEASSTSSNQMQLDTQALNASNQQTGNLMASSGSSSAAIATTSFTPSAPTAKAKLMAAQYALSCFMLGLKAYPQVSSRKMIAKVLWLLGFDEELGSGDELPALPAAIAAASAPSTTASQNAIPTTPATPSHSSTTVKMETDQSQDASSSLEPASVAHESVKREAPFSPEDERNIKRKKLAESTDKDMEHHLAPGAPSDVDAANKMDISNTSGTSTAGTSANLMEYKSMPTPSAMFVVPTPPATPSAYTPLQSVHTPAAKENPSISSTTASSSQDSSNMLEIKKVRNIHQLGKAFLEYVDQLPSWIWVIWIPQLISGLDRPESLICQSVLKRLVSHYAHALYAPLNTWMLEREAQLARQGSNIHSTYGGNPSSSNVAEFTGSSEKIGYSLAEEVMKLMREKQPMLVSDLERMTSEFTSIATLSLPEEIIDAFQKIINSSLNLVHNIASNTNKESEVSKSSSSASSAGKLSRESRRERMALQLRIVYHYVFLHVHTSSGTTNQMDVDMHGNSTTPDHPHDTAIEEEQFSNSWNSYSQPPQAPYTKLRLFYKAKFEKDFASWLGPLLTASPSLDDPHQIENVINDKIDSSSMSLKQTVQKMMDWIREMKIILSRFPTWTELNKSSWLVNYQTDNTLEIPGMYMEDKEMAPESQVYIDKFESPFRLVKSDGNPRRMITMRGNNSTLYRFTLECSRVIPIALDKIEPALSTPTSSHASPSSSSSSSPQMDGSKVSSSNGVISSDIRSKSILQSGLSTTFFVPRVFNSWSNEIRILQATRHINRYLQKDVHIRRRCASMSIPHVITFTPHLKLTSTEADFTSLMDTYQEYCNKNGMDPQECIKHCLPLLAEHRKQNPGFASSTLDPNLLLSVYNACRESVSDEVLYNYVLSRLSDNFEQLWYIRKAFTSSLANNAFIHYLFSATPSATANSFVMFPSNGNIQVFNLSSQTIQTGELAAISPSPLRLTPSILRFIGPTIHGGALDAILTASARVLSKPNVVYIISSLLEHLFKEDCVQLAREKMKPGETMPLNPNALVESVVKKNTDTVIARCTNIAPPSLATYRPDTTNAINQQITNMINASLDPFNCSKMPPSWSSWI